MALLISLWSNKKLSYLWHCVISHHITKQRWRCFFVTPVYHLPKSCQPRMDEANICLCTKRVLRNTFVQTLAASSTVKYTPLNFFFLLLFSRVVFSLPFIAFLLWSKGYVFHYFILGCDPASAKDKHFPVQPIIYQQQRLLKMFIQK